jgi:cytoskeletal protein RodZ
MNIKLSPFVVFLLLLFSLLFSVIVGNSVSNVEKLTNRHHNDNSSYNPIYDPNDVSANYHNECDDNDDETSSHDGTENDDNLDDYISKYYRKFWNKRRKMYTSDYMLKSSVVPPICPSCPTSVSCYNNNCKLSLNTSNNTTADAAAAAAANSSNTNNANHTNNAQQQQQQQPLQSPLLNYGLGGYLSNVFTTPQFQNSNLLKTNPLVSPNSSIIQQQQQQPTTAPTTTTTAPPATTAPQNNRGLAGNYNGDNAVSNTGFSNGMNPFFGFQNNDPPNVNNHFNAVPQNPIQNTSFIPLTTDFSKFGR